MNLFDQDEDRAPEGVPLPSIPRLGDSVKGAGAPHERSEADGCAETAFGRDVLAGLSMRPRAISPKWLYDAAGSALFEEITRLDAYYPTRTERAILEAHGDAMVEAIGQNAVLVEYGSGSSEKTRVLLDALHARRTLAAYVPIDISESMLRATAEALRERYDGLPILPLAADYTRPYRLPDLPPEADRVVVFFPGSTVGNFEPDEALAFLRHVADVIGDDGALLIGVDQWKDPGVLQLAYDDPEGVTAAFNLNLLRRVNRELGGDADLDAWAHRAVVDADRHRVEMHLVSLRDQTLTVCGRSFAFTEGETIHTESSHKYDADSFAALAARAGLVRQRQWTDARGWFAESLYVRRVSGA